MQEECATFGLPGKQGGQGAVAKLLKPDVMAHMACSKVNLEKVFECVVGFNFAYSNGFERGYSGGALHKEVLCFVDEFGVVGFDLCAKRYVVLGVPNAVAEWENKSCVEVVFCQIGRSLGVDI